MKTSSNSLPLSSSFNSESLFNKFWLNWQALTQSERVVSACIVLIPLWWLWGWSYLFFLLAFCLFSYELIQKKEINLSQPSGVVIFLIIYGLYDLLGGYFYDSFNNVPISIRDIFNPIDSWITPAFVIWYIQSNRIKVRPSVVVWAFSTVVFSMLLFWSIIYFVWGQAEYSPTRSLFAILTGKSSTFVFGAGNSNYLIPYYTGMNSIPGIVRYAFFFRNPEDFALVCCFTFLLALDIKSKSWSVSLLSSSIFLIIISGTRSAYVAILLVFFLRLLIILSKHSGVFLIYALIALTSFIFLCFPTVTELTSNSISSTVKSISELRADSTDVRSKIYERTWYEIVHSSDVNFWFGYFSAGETVLPGYAPAQVGTHSYYLGGLIYIKGVVGTSIFLLFWAALIKSLYATRRGRPVAFFLMYVVFTLTFTVMFFEASVMPIIIIMIVTRHPKNTSKYITTF